MVEEAVKIAGLRIDGRDTTVVSPVWPARTQSEENYKLDLTDFHHKIETQI